ncbi:restriction endonuclease subunit S [Rheinheimera faecalis]|uniref:restriction endonuclease subunit S n=1 Tax=Rheinheimera faecalis TaxID=2901141 RepID=UPI001E2C78BB|nr:restriction endonuclease subunit S [Rheinheimera faecalis]
MSESMQKLPVLRFPEFDQPWKSCKLIDIAEVYDGTHQTPKYTDEGIPFVSVENINNLYATNKFISEEDFEKNFKVKPRQNDILMTRITAGIIGATTLVESNEPLAYYVSLALIRAGEDINSRFLEKLINCEIFKRELHKRIIHVAFPKKINLGDIGECAIKIPDLDEQKKIFQAIDSIDRKIANLNKKLGLFIEYKLGIVKDIFSQRIRLKNSNDSNYEEWKTCTLGEGNLVSITTGGSNREDSTEVGKYIFFDRSTDVRKSDKYIFDCEAIIVAGEGKDFIPRYFKGKFDLHQRAYAIKDFNNCYALYIYHWVMHHRDHFLKFSVGSTMPSLRMESFTKFPIKLPEIEEQIAIANLFTKFEGKIEKIKEKIKELEAFKIGLLQKMFV